MINETPIEYVETANNLGTTFNRTLNWKDHVNKAVFLINAIRYKNQFCQNLNMFTSCD